MSLAQILSRAVLIVVCTVAGYVLSRSLDMVHPPGLGLFIGFGLAMFVLLAEAVIKKFSAKIIVGGTVGLVVGLAIAFLISYPLGRFMDSVHMAVSVYVIISCTFGYIGVTLGSGKIGEIRSSRLPFLAIEDSDSPSDKILDTSALIDGRVAEVAESGFLEGRLLVPRFILNELQAVADSADPLKRQRGRRGMEVLARLKEMGHVALEINSTEPAGQVEVDQKLIALARMKQAALVTTDYNLNQIARLQGVKVLNVNQLSQAVRPVVLPGETFTVQIVKEGKSHGQGVGYLEDGTMVVIENARRLIGQSAEVAVTSILQTSAGRMVFTELTGQHGSDRASAV